MPRRSIVPTYQLHRGSGLAKVRIDGKDVYLGPHGSPESKERYEELVRKLLTDRQRNELARKVEISSQLTVAELVAAYLKHARTYYTKGGKITSEYHNIVVALKLVLTQHGFELVGSFGPRKLKTIRDQWVEAGVVRDQVNQRVHRVRRCFAWGVAEELVPAEVLLRLRTVTALRQGRTSAVEGEGGKPVNLAHVEKILPLVDRRIGAMIRLQLLTGMRPGEVIQMTRGAIDTSGKVWVFVPPLHKTAHHGKARRVFIGPKAQEILRPWLRTELDAPLFQPREAAAERAAEMRSKRVTKLWPSHVAHQVRKRQSRPKRSPGERYSVASYRRAIARACAAAGIPAWSPHGLRHTAASEIRREFGEETTRLVLGHSKLDTTRLYGETDQAKAAEAMGKIG